MEDLYKIRKKIDSIDSEILKLIKERLKAAEEIGKIKLKEGRPITDRERERKLYEMIEQQSKELGIEPSFARKMFFDIMQLSKSKQLIRKAEALKSDLELSMAFQGEPGAYSEAAIKKTFPKCNAMACPTFYSVFESLDKGMADAALLPVENSTEGSVTPVYDLLMDSDLQAFQEVFLRIEHCLIANHGAKVAEIKEIYSHPQALEQCRGFFKRINAKPVPYYDTAGAVKMVEESGREDIAAIASEIAAGHYGMDVLEKNVEDNPNNITRFLALARNMHVHEEDGKTYKTSLVFAIRHEPGSLFKIMKVFAERDINLTKLESRPTKKIPWEYVFFVDFEGHMDNPVVSDALKDIKRQTLFLKVLGSYARGD